MRRLRPDRDAFGRVLLDYLNGREKAATVIERDDGRVDAENPAPYFDGVRKWFAVERQALRSSAAASSMSAPAPAGSRSSCKRRGHRVTAIDVSPLAVRVARKRGVKQAKVVACTGSSATKIRSMQP